MKFGPEIRRVFYANAKESMRPSISVIVPVYNNSAKLERCLTALCDSLSEDVEVIVVDDASTENIGPVAKSFACRYVRLNENKGPAYCRNLGVKESKGKILLFTDSDCYVMKNWAKIFAQTLEMHHAQDSAIKAVCGRLDSNPRFTSMSHAYTGYAYVIGKTARFIDHLNTACVGIYRSDFFEAGGFDESFRNSEDTDLGLKLLAQAKKIYFDPGVWVFHDHGIESLGKAFLKHWDWGQAAGLSLMRRYPQNQKILIALLENPLTHFLLIVPLALITTIKIVKYNFKDDLKIILYGPLIFLNKIIFRLSIFVRTFSKSGRDELSKQYF